MPFTAKETCCRVWVVLDYCCFFAVGSLGFVRLHVWLAAVAQHHISPASDYYLITNPCGLLFHFLHFIHMQWRSSALWIDLCQVVTGKQSEVQNGEPRSCGVPVPKEDALVFHDGCFCLLLTQLTSHGQLNHTNAHLVQKKKIVPMESCCRADTLLWLFLALSCVDKSCDVDHYFVCP